MPKRKAGTYRIYHVGSSKKSRYAKARSVVRKYVRRRRSRRGRRVLTNKQLTYQVKALKKIIPTGRTYTCSNNTAVSQNMLAVPLDEIPIINVAGVAAPYGRESDSLTCCLQNITIKFSMHASPGAGEAQDVNHCYCALIRSSNRSTATGEYTCPSISEIWDSNSTPLGNLLSATPWRGYREPVSDVLTNTKFLQTWKFSLSPTQMTGADSDPGPPAEPPLNGTRMLPAQVFFAHNHKCLNAKLQFESETTSTPIQATGRYYFIALGSGVLGRNCVRLNLSVKTTFKSDS